MYLTIKSTRQNRSFVKDYIRGYGIVQENWPDGSFDFTPYDEKSFDKLIEILDREKIEYESH